MVLRDEGNPKFSPFGGVRRGFRGFRGEVLRGL